VLIEIWNGRHFQTGNPEIMLETKAGIGAVTTS